MTSQSALLEELDQKHAHRVHDELDTAKPGDMFIYPQPDGSRVVLVVARYEPTGVTGTTGVNA